MAELGLAGGWLAGGWLAGVGGGEAEAAGVALVQAPVHPFHGAVWEGVADQLKFLVTDTGELLSDAHHGAVVLADDPGLVAVWFTLGHIALAAAQLH